MKEMSLYKICHMMLIFVTGENFQQYKPFHRNLFYIFISLNFFHLTSCYFWHTVQKTLSGSVKFSEGTSGRPEVGCLTLRRTMTSDCWFHRETLNLELKPETESEKEWKRAGESSLLCLGYIILSFSKGTFKSTSISINVSRLDVEI